MKRKYFGTPHKTVTVYVIVAKNSMKGDIIEKEAHTQELKFQILFGDSPLKMQI